MRNLLLLPIIICCFSCASPEGKQGSKDTPLLKNKAPEKQRVKPDASDSDASNALHNKIMGIWTGGESENATFDIRKDSVYYVDQFESFKYTLKGDHIKIRYTDYTYNAKIYFIKDTMVMDSKEFGVAKFWKFKN